VTKKEVKSLLSYLRMMLLPLKSALKQYPYINWWARQDRLKALRIWIAGHAAKTIPRGKTCRFDMDAFDRLHNSLLASDTVERNAYERSCPDAVDTICVGEYQR
jgi:hypothetical protein